ncbi:proteoglycan 4 [Bufo bufo]|uniref:proteoglycan 4 n=1 Tax=Bufo bufo TaxID=8384 RepID=UPI001ABE947C|nr:proteoglycan 4 [Bufo bufo]
MSSTSPKQGITPRCAREMKIYSTPLVFCFIISISSVSSQSEGSCVGRCGQGYVRADPCHCDYNCMSFLECCHDYKKVCTTEGSCKGRCHEGFIRGQTCDCDASCTEIGRCCLDYKEYCVKPELPPSSQDQPVHDEKVRLPRPTRKPDTVAEDVPKDRIQKDEAMPERANKVPLDRKDSNQKSPSSKYKKRPTKKSRKNPKKKKVLESEEEIEESEENMSSSSFSSSSSSSSVKGSKKTKKLSRKNQKKIKDDDEPDPDNPDRDPGDPTSKDKPKKPKKPKTKEDDDEPESPPEDPTSKDKDKPKKPKKPKTKEDDDEPESPPEDPTSKDKDKPKKPKKPKTKEDDDEPESPPEDPKLKPSSPNEGKDGNTNEPRTREDPTSDDKDRIPKKPKELGDDTKKPDVTPKDPTSDDKDRIPKKPKELGDDTKKPDVTPKEPTSDDNSGNPKTPKRTGDGPEDPDLPPKEPNQGAPDNDDDNPRKPKTPKENEGDDPEATGKPPNEPNPKEKKKPRKSKSSSLEVEEDIEERTDVNRANTEENTSQSNKRATKKRSPTNSKKKPKKPEDDADDPSQNPSPSDRKKKKPNSRVPNKKKARPTDGDDPSENPSDKGKKKPNSKEPNMKKGKPTDDDGDEPSKPGKEKNRKKKPNPKGNTKLKKKIDSEEERQETVESAFSSSSQSSSSHTRSKSTRRLTGKNKKKLKDKKKTPDIPEDPLMPPKTKKDKGSPPTPVPTFKDEGSGDDGSGMDFLSTTTPTTTVHSTTTLSQTTREKNQTEGTVNPSKSATKIPDVTLDNGRSTTPNIQPTKEGPEKTTNVMNASTQSPIAEDTTTGKDMTTDTTLQQMSKLKTPQDQSTVDSSDITLITVSGKLQGTTNTLSFNSEPVDPTKHTVPITYDATTQKREQAQTMETIAYSDITVITESTTRHSDHTTKTTTKEPSTEPQQKPTTEQLVKVTTEKSEDESEISTTMSTGNDRPTTTKSIVVQTTKHTDEDDTEMSTKSMHPTKRPYPRGFPTYKPTEPEEMENTKSTKPSTTNQYHVCDLLKDEAIKLRISDNDLQHIIEICTEMQQQYQYPLVSTPSPDIKQPNADDRNIPASYPHPITPNWNQQPGTRIIQIVEEIYRRMNSSPVMNITVVHGYTIHKPSKWLLLLNKIKSSNDPEKNLCIGPPADGMTTLQNGSMVVFRGHYFWTLNQGGVMGCPRKITEVWGIPSPIDTVFTRCNCGGKTFFFKDSRYWRFTNDVMDKGYPKESIKGFGGLRGKVTAILPVAGYRTRPESVYFFKPGGNVQKYTFRQEQAKRCTKKKRPSIQYPIYPQNIQTVRYRFPRDVVRHRIQIHRTFTAVQQPLGVLHEQTLISSTWRGIPNNIMSAVSLPNSKKQDGFDYYVFSKDKYYNINMSSKTAVKPPPGSEQKTSKDWYKCKE